jgi:hypothetical protein
MTTDATPIFDAALGLPQPLRADLAAKLLESLEYELPQPDDRTPDEWLAVIKARSDAVHNGQAELIDGQVVADKLQAIMDRAGRKS